MQNNNKNNCNTQLIGNWRTTAISTGIYYDISNECLMYINGSYPYSFPDENTLHYGRDTFYRRISGEPNNLIGVWLDDNTQEQLTFFEDGRLESSVLMMIMSI